MLHRLATSVAVIITLVFSGAMPALATDRPHGNNGTVKVDDQPLDSTPNNNPHVGCKFRVDFYGYKNRDGAATVSFEVHSPTNDPIEHSLEVVSGNLNPALTGQGQGSQLSASETYVLALTGPPHPKQGFHVKLTVTAPGSKGADRKHKVFWVEDCPVDVPEPTPTPTEPPEPHEPSKPGKPTKTATPAATAPTPDGPPGPTPTEEPVPVPTSLPAGSEPADSGRAGSVALIGAMTALIAGGVLFARRRFSFIG